MGRIKSALEIAFERTEAIKGDKSGVEQFEAKRKGKRLANEFLEDENAPSLAETLKDTPESLRASLKEGIFEALLPRINLPNSQDDGKYTQRTGEGLQSLIKDQEFQTLYHQFQEAVSRYFAEAAQYAEALKAEYEPRLRQKSAELSKRLGQKVKLDPFQDPEFEAFYKQNMDALKKSYQAVADQMREKAARFFENEKE